METTHGYLAFILINKDILPHVELIQLCHFILRCNVDINSDFSNTLHYPLFIREVNNTYNVNNLYSQIELQRFVSLVAPQSFHQLHFRKFSDMVYVPISQNSEYSHLEKKLWPQIFNFTFDL